MAAPDLVSLLNHLKGLQTLSQLSLKYFSAACYYQDFTDLKEEDISLWALESETSHAISNRVVAAWVYHKIQRVADHYQS